MSIDLLSSEPHCHLLQSVSLGNPVIPAKGITDTVFNKLVWTGTIVFSNFLPASNYNDVQCKSCEHTSQRIAKLNDMSVVCPLVILL